jgi:hydrogenase expression/formation protein HypE
MALVRCYAMNKLLPLGKLSSALLAELIPLLPIDAPEIRVTPGVGCDAGGLMIGNQLVAVTMDPITFSTHNLGTYSVCVNINDIACLGCRPRWYSATLLLPQNTTEKAIRDIWQELGEQLRQYDLISIGGHTEVTTAVNQPVLIGHMIGQAIGDRLLNPADAAAGDQILLWQGVAIEGTALLAHEREQDLKKYFSDEKLAAMQNLIRDPGICVWPLVEKLMPDNNIIALHDPTEGGIATALHELADAAQCGLHINVEAIPVLPETAELAALLQFDPLGLLASGSLLIVCRTDAVQAILQKFPNEPLCHIGELTAKNDRVLPRYDTDEIVKAMRKII